MADTAESQQSHNQKLVYVCRSSRNCTIQIKITLKNPIQSVYYLYGHQLKQVTEATEISWRHPGF